MAAVRATLADLDAPPDTSVLAQCDELETACAIEQIRARLLRRRKALARSNALGSEADRVIAGLRRIQNPHICAYRHPKRIVVSEPFNGVPSVITRAPLSSARRMVAQMLGTSPPAPIVGVLASFGSAALRAAVDAGVRIAIIPDAERLVTHSTSLARCVPNIDEWSAPPSGLFVVEERRVLLRDRALLMTTAHEFAHALDAILARRRRSYFSFESTELRHYFATATGYVNEYAATGLDEYFAESVRAYVEVNDGRCAWLPLTRQDLFLRDPRMFGLVDRLFASRFRSG